MLCYFIYIIWVDVHKLDIVVFTLPAERMAKMRKHKTKDEKDKECQKDCERKAKKIAEMSEDQLIELGLKNKINKIQEVICCTKRKTQ